MGLDKRSKEYKLDKKTWEETRARITTKMQHDDFIIMCQLHSKYYEHKYYVPCTCNKRLLRKWIKELDSKLLN